MKAQNTVKWFLMLTMTWGSLNAFAKDKAASTPAKPTAQSAVKPTDSPQVEKLDVTDLENKYWAPKDTDFSVVQNRTYTKEHKFFISGEFGPDLNNSYSAGNHIAVTGNYFFNERSGIQVTYMKSSLHDNRALGDLASLGGKPDYGVPRGYYGIGYDWVPFYAKMSFLGRKIMYFDMAITPTIGMTQYDQMLYHGSTPQNAFTYGVDVTQYFFFNNHWAFRIDLKNQWYNEEIIKYQGGASVRSQNDREMIALFGFTFYFGK
jgi:outer membrane beta-barrel protein